MLVRKSFVCNQCGNQGWAEWDQRQPVMTSDSFYLRVPNGFIGIRQVVCLCGSVQQNAIAGCDG